MPIKPGDQIPDVTVQTKTADGIAPVQTADVLGTGKVVLFAVPGAFTPTCSDYHLPGYVAFAEEISNKGVDTIACIAVNDAFVMGAWGDSQGAGEAVLMLADGNGDFTKAIELEMDGSGFGLGTRSQRYAAIINDGVVEQIFVESGPGLDVSGAEKVLAAL